MISEKVKSQIQVVQGDVSEFTEVLSFAVFFDLFEEFLELSRH